MLFKGKFKGKFRVQAINKKPHKGLDETSLWCVTAANYETVLREHTIITLNITVSNVDQSVLIPSSSNTLALSRQIDTKGSF